MQDLAVSHEMHDDNRGSQNSGKN